MLNWENSTETAYKWHPNPTTRGTWDIYSTCAVTICLCVWQAVHMNIPPPGEPKYKHTFRQGAWLVLTLIAPELVALNAWKQYSDARTLLAAVRAVRPREPQLNWYSKLFMSICGFPDRLRMEIWYKHRQRVFNSEQFTLALREAQDHGSWTMETAYYATCGGVATPPSTLEPIRLYFTPSLLDWLWICERTPQLLPCLVHHEIADKGKANSIAKSIICVQASWFCVECISRLAHGLSISLLELNTFAHCICAFLIYGFWWHKPYDIASHTFLDEKVNFLRLQCELGLDYNWTSDEDVSVEDRWRYGHGVNNNCDVCRERETLHPYEIVEDRWNRRLYELSRYNWKLVLNHEAFVMANTGLSLRVCWRLLFTQNHSEDEPDIVQISDGEAIPGTGFTLHEHRKVVDREGTSVPLIIKLSQVRLAMFQKLWEHVQRHKSEHIHRANKRTSGDPFDWLSLWGHGMTQRSRNWKITFKNIASWSGMSAVCIAALSYGSLHLLAWDYCFSSRIESRLWRISGIMTASFGPLCVLGVFSLGAVTVMLGDAYDLWGIIPIFCLGACVILASTLARAYLVIEAVIALPRSSDSIYKTPNWTMYFPHIS